MGMLLDGIGSPDEMKVKEGPMRGSGTFNGADKTKL